MNDEAPLDADELMNFSVRIERLPPDDAEWVGRLFAECLRARMHEAELLAGQMDDVLKSSLFARIREGKRPLPFPPPTRQGSPWHDLIEKTEARYHIDAEVLRGEDGHAVGVLSKATMAGRSPNRSRIANTLSSIADRGRFSACRSTTSTPN